MHKVPSVFHVHTTILLFDDACRGHCVHAIVFNGFNLTLALFVDVNDSAFGLILNSLNTIGQTIEILLIFCLNIGYDVAAAHSHLLVAFFFINLGQRIKVRTLIRLIVIAHGVIRLKLAQHALITIVMNVIPHFVWILSAIVTRVITGLIVHALIIVIAGV